MGHRDPPVGQPASPADRHRGGVRLRRGHTGGGGPGAALGRVRRHRRRPGPAVAGDARRHPGSRAGRPDRQGNRATAARAGQQRQDAAVPGQGTTAGRASGGTVMTAWHVDDETLRRYVERTDSVAEGASVEQHLLTCALCRARANRAATAFDLAAVWERTRDAVEVPLPSPFERLLRAAGLPAHEARLVAVASAFRGAWLLGVAAVLAFTAFAAMIGHARGLWLFLAVAPLAPCLVVAVSYDRRWDPAL